MLKHDLDLKNDLREKGWYERDKTEVYWTSFLRSENSGAEFGFKFECIWIKLVLSSHVISHDYWFKSETRIFTISVFAKDSGRVQSIDEVSHF